MKNNIKALELIEKGLTAKTVSKLTESQIAILHSRLVSEQPQPQITSKTVKQIKLQPGAQTTIGNVSVTNQGGTTTITSTNEELEEEEEVTIDPNKDTETQDPHQVGPSSNDGFDMNDDGMYNFESIEEAKKTKKNPWAICTAQLGDEFGTTERSEWTKAQMNKYERCVKDVKKSLKEGKNPVSLFIENEIIKIVEKHIPPRITKSDFMNYLKESEPTVAPPKPKKPVTKPDTKPRPTRPGQNPFPGEKEAPKAVSPEVAKQKVIDTIMNILSK